MKTGGDPRRHRRALSALVALTLLPVAMMVATSHGPATASSSSGAASLPASLRTLDLALPSAEATERGQASNLFAPFTWDGLVASGPFVRFDYLAQSGTILDYRATNGSESSVIVDSITVDDFEPSPTPLIAGATFAATGNNLMIVAHDEPTALLEIRTLGQAQNVTFRFPYDTTGLQASHATMWPASALSFTDGNLSGRMIVGRGGLDVNGTTVKASLTAQDYLAVRAVPGFLEHPAERTALLDAFASGRLAAEFDLVAVSNGGWLEDSARYHAVPGTVDSSVAFNSARVSIGMPNHAGGLVLLAFDPKTMPVDSQHRLAVRGNGSDIPQTSDPLASLFSLPGSSEHATYVRLEMNATVLAVYVPDLSAATLQIQSVELPPPGIDRPTQLAIVAALFVVTLAGAVMFRRRAE